MTQEVQNNVLKELAKAGVLFLVLGVIIYYLYGEFSKNQEELRTEVKALRIETKECSKSYQNLLLNQLEENTNALEKSNDLVNEFRQSYINQSRRKWNSN